MGHRVVTLQDEVYELTKKNNDLAVKLNKAIITLECIEVYCTEATLDDIYKITMDVISKIKDAKNDI